MQRITFEWINQFKEQLLNLAKLTEPLIQSIFIRNGEKVTTNFEKLKRSWGVPSPFYQHMIFKFRESGDSPFQFCKACDPANQQRVLGYFRIYCDKPMELVEFFSWIRNYLGIVDIYELDGTLNNIGDAINCELYKLWQTNEINFFFGVSDEIRDKLIKRYNKECVDTYNEILKKK